MDVCLLWVLSGRGLFDELITRPKGPYRLWCVVVRDLETSRVRRPWSALGRRKENICIYTFSEYIKYFVTIEYSYVNFSFEFQTMHIANCRSRWTCGPSCGYAADSLLGLRVRIPPGAWRSVCCESCVLSGRGLCDELITRPEEAYQLWCVVVCVWSRILVNEEALTHWGFVGPWGKYVTKIFKFL